MKNILIKSLTLVSFVGLIMVFISYKSGFFRQRDAPFLPSKSSNVINIIETDSLKRKDTTKVQLEIDSAELERIRIMSSSKSIIIFDPKVNTDRK
ncbi:MAG: hypothetical protein COB15_06715 [Flavobacteriales bacterium]|nr:MAG: hypothetical protein COB15_06715 [Flavobacteriales bacterium]